MDEELGKMIRKAMLVGCVAALFTLSGSGCCVNRGMGGFDSCGGGCCPGPFGALRNAVTCGSGCGEIYWDEWISDPPDCCDPCDPCTGGFVGPRACCGPRPLAALAGFIVGHRYDGSGDCCAGGPIPGGHVSHGGCTSCGHPTHGHVIQTDESYEAQPTPPRTPPQPTPAGSVSTPRRYDRPYYSRSMPANPVSHPRPHR